MSADTPIHPCTPTVQEALNDSEEEKAFDLKTAWRDQFQKAILPEYSPEEGNLTLAMTLHYVSFSFKVWESVGHCAISSRSSAGAAGSSWTVACTPMDQQMGSSGVVVDGRMQMDQQMKKPQFTLARVGQGTPYSSAPIHGRMQMDQQMGKPQFTLA